MRRIITTIVTASALSLSAVVAAPAFASEGSSASKSKCDQAALASYNSYYQARKAILAAYKTVINAAKVTFEAAKQSGVASVRKAARANYQAAILSARATRDSALSALGSPPPYPKGCKRSSGSI